MSFASPSELLQRYDSRVLGDLVADLGANVSPAALLSDANLQTQLDDAAGEIVAACVPNQRYTLAELNQLAGSGLPSGFLLKKINCALALPGLLGRRFYNNEDNEKRIPDFKWVMEYLEKLKNGIRVFELPVKNLNAGVMRTAALGSAILPEGLVGHKRRCYGITPVNENDP